MSSFLNESIGRSINTAPGMPPFGTMFFTNGPTINNMTLQSGWTGNPAGDIYGDPYSQALQEWRLNLSVSSSVGLSEVLIWDGDTIIRRFLPGGATTFINTNIALTKERQKHIWVQVTDLNGKKAVSRNIDCYSPLLRESQCSDRNNQLLDSTQKRPDNSTFAIGMAGSTATPDKGPWYGYIKPVGCFVFDDTWGGGAAYDGAPATPWANLFPYLSYGGQTPADLGFSYSVVAGREGGPHIQPRRVVASSDVLVADRILDGVFPLSANPVYHVWHTLYPVVGPSQYLQTTARVYHYRTKIDGITTYLWDQSFKLLQTVPIGSGNLCDMGLGEIYSDTTADWILVSNGAVVASGSKNTRPMTTYSFNKGDYIGFLNGTFGSLVVYSLTNNLTLRTDGINCWLGYDYPGTQITAGTTIQARLLMVGFHKNISDITTLTAKVRTDYGLGITPSYTMTPIAGTMVSQEFLCALMASDFGFKGTFSNIAGLEGNLGCTISGLNDNWTACFLSQGAVVKTRMMPVEQGVGYAVLTADDNNIPVFMGHPFVADRSDVVLNLSRIAPDGSWQLEVHNPTSTAMTVTMTRHPQATPSMFDYSDETFTNLPAGSSVFRTIPYQFVASAPALHPGDANSDDMVDVGDLGILAANYGFGTDATLDFSADYAKVFSTTVAEEDDSANDSISVCSGLGLPLIAGLLLMGLLMIKIEKICSF